LRIAAHDILHKASALMRPAVADAANCFRGDDKVDMASASDFGCCVETSSSQDLLGIAFVPGSALIGLRNLRLMLMRASSIE
jgi:hypothetical protein